jgi:hypothetical protein
MPTMAEEEVTMAWQYRSREWIAAYQRAWYASRKGIDAPKRIRRTQAFRLKVRALLRTVKAKRGCARCPEVRPAALQFHHRDHHAKAFNVSEAIRHGYSIQTIMAEIAKCDVLCATCHAIETDANRHTYRRPAAVQPEPVAQPLVSTQQAFDFEG